MKNIKDYKTFLFEKNRKSPDSWSTISKKEDGIHIDDTPVDKYGEKILTRTIKRVKNTSMDKLCGGVQSVESEIDKRNKIKCSRRKHTLQDVLKLTDSTPVGTCGYVKLNDSDNLFQINPKSIGKGEVLLSWAFPDVRMKNRDEEEIGDCAIYDPSIDIYDGKDIDIEKNVLYNIEVKSGGSEFRLRDPEETKDHYAEAITDHIISRYRTNKKPLIFIFFDNKIHSTDFNGFFWIHCGTSKSDKDKILETIKKVTDVGVADYNKPKKGLFAITIDDIENEDYKGKGIKIHPRKKSEI